MVTPGMRAPVVSVITPPENFVTVQDVKDYQVIEHSEWDRTRVPLALNAAFAMLDGPRGWLGRALAEQTLELACYDCTAIRFDLPCPPVIEITQVVYDDANGNEQTLATSAYRLRRGAFEAISSLPTFNELRIRYRAGYTPRADSPAEEPKEWQQARMAILLLAGDFLRNTDANIPAPGMFANPAVENLLAPLRIRTIA
jgi:hypothetical protein